MTRQQSGQSWLCIEAIDPGSAAASTHPALQRGMLLRTVQGRCVVGLSQAELLFLPMDERPLVLEFTPPTGGLVGDARYDALAASLRAEADARETEVAIQKRIARKSRLRRFEHQRTAIDGTPELDAPLWNPGLEPPPLRYNSQGAPFNHPLVRRWATGVGASFGEQISKARQDLRDSEEAAAQISRGSAMSAVAGGDDEPSVPQSPPSLLHARRKFTAVQHLSASQHLARLDREHLQLSSSALKAQKKQLRARRGRGSPQLEDDYDVEGADGLGQDGSHLVYLPRSLHDLVDKMPLEMQAVLDHSYHQNRGHSLKALVSKKKRRFLDPHNDLDLDLTYIVPSIVAMGFPSEGREAAYRNRMADVQRFLDTRHPGAYRVYNLCSERCYPASRFAHDRCLEGAVGEYPFDDHNPPTLQTLKACCEDMHVWLRRGEQPGGVDGGSVRNPVAAVHCKAGKGRTGTVIAAYLLRAGEFDDVDDALAYYAHCRTLNGKGVTIPSQVRYVHYYGRWFDSDMYHEPLPAATLTLLKIRAVGVPRFSGHGDKAGCTPYYRVRQYGCSSETGQMEEHSFFDLKVHGDEAPWLQSSASTEQILIRRAVASQPFVDFDTRLELSGNVLLELVHADRGNGTKMCSMWFHTAFVHHKKIVFTKAHIDKACKDADCHHFPAHFQIELYFDNITHDLPDTLAHDHAAMTYGHTPAAADAMATAGPKESAGGAGDATRQLRRQRLQARRLAPLPTARLYSRPSTSSEAAAAVGAAKTRLGSTTDGGGLPRLSTTSSFGGSIGDDAMPKRPGARIDAVRRCLEVVAHPSHPGNEHSALAVEAQLAFGVAHACASAS